MDTHKYWYDELRKNTLVMQFYATLVKGKLEEKERELFLEIERNNISRLKKFIDLNGWDGRYDLAIVENEQTIKFTCGIKNKLPVFKQTAQDNEIANFISANPTFFNIGISIEQLVKLGNIDTLLNRGHFFHDHFFGYAENNYLEISQSDCLDYLNSAIFYYNEGYDLFYGRKKIQVPTQDEVMNLPPFEFKRIHDTDEVMYRSFKESFINLILFVESFINAVGYDAFLKGVAKNVSDENRLKGIKNINSKNGHRRYSNFREKLEDISSIIGNNGFNVNAEPFLNYLDIYVELRNAYVHSSPERGKIWYSTEDWKNKCDDMIINYCFPVVESFWKACYPTTPFPAIIFNAYFNTSFKGYRGAFRI